MATNNGFKKTRIAPTPSGFLHLGNVLSFAVTAFIARNSGAKILLRVDDLDQARVNEHYIRDIFDTLHFLNIPWDEGPGNVQEFNDRYSQVHRLSLYRDALQQLNRNGVLYACTCSRRQLSAVGTETAGRCACINKQLPLTTVDAGWRLITNTGAVLTVNKYKGQAIQAALPVAMNNFIVKKKDGFPAYQLTSLIDDLFYGVDLIIRGDDLWPSTLAQHKLASALGQNSFGDIAFYHHPLLVDASQLKLSKSAGATSVKYLRQNGKNAAAVYSLIAAMLGFNKTIENWQQLAESFLSDAPGITV